LSNKANRQDQSARYAKQSQRRQPDTIVVCPQEHQQFAVVSCRLSVGPPAVNWELRTADYRKTPCGVTTNGLDSAKQSQRSCRRDGGHSPPYANVVDSTKQSQPAENPTCETKPTEADGCVCSVPTRAYHVAQPPSAGITAGGGGAPCAATNGVDSVKQNQRPKPATGFVAVPRHMHGTALS